MVDTKYRNNTIADFIFQLRKANNLTYAELEELTGVSRSVLNRIERGETKRLEFKNLKAVAIAFPAHYSEIMECYLEEESRINTLFEVLEEVTTCEECFLLVPKVAVRILESHSVETEEALQRLFDFTQTVTDNSLKVTLYTSIIKFSRERGVPHYVAKGLLQKYLIERNDLKQLEESFQVGQEILHYTSFLSREGKITVYFRMALHAYAIKKFEECIQLCEKGLLLEEEDTGLKAKAYLAMINSFSQLGDYESVERHLNIFEKMRNDFVVVPAKATRALTKARKKEYDVAIPLLRKYLGELGKEYSLHIADELLEIYFQLGDLESIAEILEKEEELLPEHPQTPHKYITVGRFHRYKGFYHLSKGLLDDGIENYVKSLKAFGYVSAMKEKDDCMQELLTYHIKLSKSLELKHIIKLKEAYE
ncbi:helix-turn-helix transcriptional regulator [Paenibacillus sp. MZ04-78.2]|uniref:helix-turn-helix domain-containing protein n=1 Tax=Paenibacillus sp. MZ04-78.2 TaxID=2962034 RepID=UPI0020B817ED|nr:helix-turn-helix transcriptional regulator [Paenibacillus sp. MZ04-78.2]MCP3776453.1 helix-turn-helix transcriptional regulator [Paenibacillus sp. MZ04-78.2]